MGLVKFGTPFGPFSTRALAKSQTMTHNVFGQVAVACDTIADQMRVGKLMGKLVGTPRHGPAWAMFFVVFLLMAVESIRNAPITGPIGESPDFGLLLARCHLGRWSYLLWELSALAYSDKHMFRFDFVLHFLGLRACALLSTGEPSLDAYSPPSTR